jgi:hypothetical protein
VIARVFGGLGFCWGRHEQKAQDSGENTTNGNNGPPQRTSFLLVHFSTPFCMGGWDEASIGWAGCDEDSIRRTGYEHERL